MSKTGASRARGPSPPPTPPARRVRATHWCCLSRLPQGPGVVVACPQAVLAQQPPLGERFSPSWVPADSGCLWLGSPRHRPQPQGSVWLRAPTAPSSRAGSSWPLQGGLQVPRGLGSLSGATKSPAQRPRAGTVPAVPVSPCSLSLHSPESPPWALCGSISTALDPVPLTGGVPWHPCPCCP